MRILRERLGEGTSALENASQLQTTIAFSVFTLPLLLFSLPGGFFADHFSKRTLMVRLKALEVVLMTAATISLLLGAANQTWNLILLGLLGVQTALFSPAKYGCLPEILSHEDLSAGNALLEMWTFVAIIVGTASAGWLLDLSGERTWLVGVLLMGFSLFGFFASRQIPVTPVACVGGDMRSSLRDAYRAIRNDRPLGLALLGLGLFWFVASLLGQDILVYAKSRLHLSDTYAGLPLALYGIGIGIGTPFAARLSRGKVEVGLIPLGASLMVLGCVGIAATAPALTLLLALMLLLGVASGLLIVPLNALLQWRSPDHCRGSVIALSNTLVFAGVFVGSLLALGFTQIGLSTLGIVWAASLVVAGGTLWALYLLPEAFLRLCLLLLTTTIYRLRVLGRANFPDRGGVLLVPNHVSFVDVLMLISSVDRPIRFIADQSYFENPFLHPFMKAMGVIPISEVGGPRVILRALRRAGEYLDAGEVVCIFPEGQITRTGTLLPFRRGLERIAKNRKAAIVPVYLDRLWGSIFSREGGRFVTKLPKEIPYSVTLVFGEALPAETPLFEIRRKVQELASAAWFEREKSARTLAALFVRSARKRPFRTAFVQIDRPAISAFRALAASIALARSFRKSWRTKPYAGILLPPSIPCALANLAATLAGKGVVNLNYTAGQAGFESSIQQAGLHHIVTSRAFLEKIPLKLPSTIETICLEDLQVSLGLRGISLVAAALLPFRWLVKFCGAERAPSPGDVTTIVFSSGSTGEPKGVLLTHFNLESNVRALGQVFRVTKNDSLLGILPFFHSFGFMSFWFAIENGLPMPLHPNPLDAASVGELVRRQGVTLLLATPTFLQLYMRRCTPAQFGSLRLVLTGAEKLSERLALAFEDTFGIRPLEGYGATECAPTIAASVPDFRAAGFFQPGSRRGFVGQPLPGVSLRIVDPDSMKDLPADAPGLLLVKGPNVMMGYLNRPDLTEKAKKDGWYITGDIATVNEDGFLKITDRLSRFSKIGGEMVPHGRVETALHEAANLAVQTFAVTAIPDERKGEALAVIHTFDEAKIPELIEKLGTLGLPNLYIPRKERFFRVSQLPLLGTGKLNLQELKKIALEANDGT